PSSGTVGPLLWHHLGLLLGLLSALRRDRRLGLAALLLLATAPRSSRRSRDRAREGLPPPRPGYHLASPGRRRQGSPSLHTCTVSPRWAGHGLACGLWAEQATLGLPDRSSLCVNPSLTIAALAERASALL